jgi:polysaccharide export outer membrane protein
MRYLIRVLWVLLALACAQAAWAQGSRGAPAPPTSMFPQPQGDKQPESVLGPGDVVRITVYQNPDLNTETRISELGSINFPLIGQVPVGGSTLTQAEQAIAKKLRDGGFVLRPQVSMQLVSIRSNQISILGQVNKPGRYPIDLAGSRVSEMVALAGGVLPSGADVVTLVGSRNGNPIKMDIDLPAIMQAGKNELDVTVENGDIIYVDRAPVAYIYGEVQHPGPLRIERGMTLLQALATAGGVTARGTEKGIRVTRREGNGTVHVSEMRMNDLVERDDVIYVKESLF